MKYEVRLFEREEFDDGEYGLPLLIQHCETEHEALGEVARVLADNPTCVATIYHNKGTIEQHYWQAISDWEWHPFSVYPSAL